MARSRSTMSSWGPLTRRHRRPVAASGRGSPDLAADAVDHPAGVVGAGVVVAVLGLAAVVLAAFAAAVLAAAVLAAAVLALLGRAVVGAVALVGLLRAPVGLAGRRRGLLRRVAVVGIAGVARAVIAVVGVVAAGAGRVSGRVATGGP